MKKLCALLLLFSFCTVLSSDSGKKAEECIKEEHVNRACAVTTRLLDGKPVALSCKACCNSPKDCLEQTFNRLDCCCAYCLPILVNDTRLKPSFNTMKR